MKDKGKTILFSTHILDDVERICDTVGMIVSGQMVFEKPLRQLQKENTHPIFEISLFQVLEKSILDKLKELKGVLSILQSEKTLIIKVVDNEVSELVIRVLLEGGILIESFSIRLTRLEDLFLRGVPQNEK